jgi:hypothetical protein
MFTINVGAQGRLQRMGDLGHVARACRCIEALATSPRRALAGGLGHASWPDPSSPSSYFLSYDEMN